MRSPDTKFYVCEHVEEARRVNPRAKSYINIYAGKSVRIELCRLCSTTALGVIVSARIREAIDPKFQEEHDFV